MDTFGVWVKPKTIVRAEAVQSKQGDKGGQSI
jgi:hypothetical protein